METLHSSFLDRIVQLYIIPIWIKELKSFITSLICERNGDGICIHTTRDPYAMILTLRYEFLCTNTHYWLSSLMKVEYSCEKNVCIPKDRVVYSTKIDYAMINPFVRMFRN